MRTNIFDFDLPETLIATHPADPRDSARMLVAKKGTEIFSDLLVRDLPSLLQPQDIMVFNDSRVIPARLYGRRGEARVEVTLHRINPRLERGSRAQNQPIPAFAGMYSTAFAKPAKRLRPGDRIDFAEDFSAEVVEKLDDGQIVLRFDENLFQNLERHGHMPLPPYIRKGQDAPQDKTTYQTVYAKHDGSVAAPTAGLHFTPELLRAIDAMGITRAYVTLHVGGGTFLPVKTEDTNDHVMHSEFATISEETVRAINQAKARGGRVIAVGTTALRTLESAADDNGLVHPMHRDTDIFITPGYQFKCVDVLMTNFHLPRSTLFMLICAFAGTERMKATYAHAIKENYRFYSYGDACWLYRAS